MKALILARVSTEEQKEAGNSLPAQLERLKNYCERKGLTISDTFSFDESAYKQQREKFNEILDKIKTNKETIALVCDKIDRLIRNFTQDLVTLENLRYTGKIELHFPSDNIILHKDSPAPDLFHFTIGVGLAKYYSDSISDNVKRAFEAKLRRGEILGPAPYGYRNTKMTNGNKWVVPEPFEFQVVKTIFTMYASSLYSMAVIRIKLNEDFNINLSNGGIDHILNNKFYCGFMKYKGAYYQHPYERAIDEEIYDKVQEVKAGKCKPNQPKAKYGGKLITYRGMIKCAYCGCSITADRKKDKYTYYYCTDYFKKHKVNNIPVEYIIEDDLTDQFAKMFEQMYVPSKIVDKITNTLKASHDGKKEIYKIQYDQLVKQHKEYETMLESLYDDKASKCITIDEYNKRYDRYRSEQVKVEGRLSQLTKADDNYYVSANTVLSLASRAHSLFKSSKDDEKQQILQLVLSNCVLDGKKVQYNLTKPFDVILECASHTTWLRA